MIELPTTAVADQATVDVAVGGRVLVVSDLRLGTGATLPGGADPPAQTATVAQLTSAIEAWSGPGALVFNGNLVTLPAGAGHATAGQAPESKRVVSAVRSALTAHPRLVEVTKAFASGPGRLVLVLPGAADACLAWHAGARDEVARQLGAEFALSATLHISTGGGTRQVQVEPGHRLDPLAAFCDPRNPGESPLAQHLRNEVLPAASESQRSKRRGSWLAGAEQLDDPAVFPRFVASRLTYRRLARALWLLLVPIVAGIALRVPALALARTRGLGHTGARTAVLVGAGAVEIIVLALVITASIRGTWQALSAVSLGAERRDPNEAPRSLARDLVTAGGHTGLITGHTCRPELTHLGTGFYANTGCATEVVAEVAGRLPGLGLPSVFLRHRQTAWVELEAGAELHVRLFYARSDLPGATVAERIMAHRGPDATESRGDGRPEVVATFPQGQSWPPAANDQPRRRLVRRVAALFVAGAGFVTLVSSLSDPVRDRLANIRDLFPLVVPETAAAVAALAGLGLLLLARGIRRGQHRAWVVCQAVLLLSAALHLVKGGDIEEAVVALAVASFLWVNRASFRAAADTPPFRRGIAAVAGAAVTTIVAGALGIEISTWVSAATRRAHHFHLSWARAFQAIVERGVGIHSVFLPRRIDDFVSPAAVVVTIALAVVALALTFRPVVVRARHRSGSGRGSRFRRDGASAEASGSGSAEQDLIRARGMVARHGSGTLDYFALRPDKDFFFWGDTVVAYAVYGGVCLVSPDPIGPVAERDEAWRAFRAFVDRHGWALGGLGIGEEWLPIYRATGMHDLYVGDEGVVRTDRFTLEGGRFKGLRQAVNRVAKYGYTISFHDPSHLDPALRAQLREVMTKSRRGDVERGFSMTLGRVFEGDDKDLLLAVVHGPPALGVEPETPGPPVAFCQYVPAPGIKGYSLDLMRRDDGEHPNGLIDFAVVETIRHLRARGAAGLGLNFATMRAVLAGEAGEGLTTKVQAWLLRRMGDSMQIESLWKFNAKFDPDWQPRYAIYDAPENALATAIAMARAESFWELPIIGRFLVPSVGRMPAGPGPDGDEGAATPAPAGAANPAAAANPATHSSR
ncbi:MAG: DUF2156 domain-containing protein [Actinomycetota bacterium]|nr:DUF2156 domain-containing protein [Actinomycetota bacterium]